MRNVLLAAAVASALAAGGVVPAAALAGGPISYTTLFQDPAAGPDHSLEHHAVELIDATPAGERIAVAFRDYNSDPVTDALIRAHDRGVLIDGVVDGDEHTQATIQHLLAVLGPEHFVICGAPTFVFDSCIANSMKPSLQHNKFLTFSRLEDGRSNVVLETSENFFGPSQFNYYNDMDEIDGDEALYDAYVRYVADMQAQARSDDHFLIESGDDGRNTIFLSPRRQPDFDTADTVVDRLDEVDCSEGGAPDGHGLIRVANMAFRSERAVIMRKLVALHDEGCDVEVVLSNADGDILSGLVAAGIPMHPFFLRSIAGVRPQVMVHDKFMLVDATSTVTGRRTKITYAGTSNWRADEQYSDDLMLRMVDDGVYDAYLRYWNLVASRASSDQSRPKTDSVAPAAALTVTPRPNAAFWNRSAVTVRIAASDGHNVQAIGLKRLHVEFSGAQTGLWDFLGEHDGYTVQELPITAEGDTTVTYFAEDAMGNVGPRQSTTVRIDETPPAIGGLPEDCVLWPPDNRMAHVADVSATDAGSGVRDLVVDARSDSGADEGDVLIDGGSVDLRAEKGPQGAARTYVVTAAATDLAGNRAEASGTCLVPHSQGGS